MEEDLKVWPHLLEMLFACNLHNANQYAEHPWRNARDIGDILVESFVGYAVALNLEVAQQSSLLARNSDKVGKRIDILDENGTKVANQRAWQIVVRRMAATKD